MHRWLAEGQFGGHLSRQDVGERQDKPQHSLDESINYNVHELHGHHEEPRSGWPLTPLHGVHSPFAPIVIIGIAMGTASTQTR